MTNKTGLRLAAVLGLLAVGLGGFGAHTLKDLLKANETAGIWEKAVFYHFIHALMLFILAGRTPFRFGPFICFLIGILIFSGSLYLLAVTNVRWLGAITPLGALVLWRAGFGSHSNWKQALTKIIESSAEPSLPAQFLHEC